MRKQLSVFYLCFMLVIFSSCKKGKIKELNSIGYGTSFGMCAGYCNQSLLISDLKLSFSKSKNGQVPDTKNCNKSISETEVNALKRELNLNQLADLPEVIGCPDCADGGAEWISVNADGKQYKIIFGYDQAPKELENAVSKLKVLMASFKDCN